MQCQRGVGPGASNPIETQKDYSTTLRVTIRYLLPDLKSRFEFLKKKKFFSLFLVRAGFHQMDSMRRNTEVCMKGIYSSGLTLADDWQLLGFSHNRNDGEVEKHGGLKLGHLFTLCIKPIIMQVSSHLKRQVWQIDQTDLLLILSILYSKSTYFNKFWMAQKSFFIRNLFV